MKKEVHKQKQCINTWQIQEAKAKFSKLIEEVRQSGYQTITKQGIPVAVVLSKEEFDRLTKPKNTLLEFFKNSPYPEIELNITRSKDPSREIDL